MIAHDPLLHGGETLASGWGGLWRDNDLVAVRGNVEVGFWGDGEALHDGFIKDECGAAFHHLDARCHG